MSNQQSFKPIHLKVLEVFRSKSSKKNINNKDPRQNLFFKIKPEKAISQLIIPYKDLRDNFPYALIQYYENKTKAKNENTNCIESLIQQIQNNTQRTINIIPQNIRQGKNQKKKSNIAKKDQQIIPQQKDNQIKDDNHNKDLMFDYDKYLQSNDRSFKSFNALFSETQPHQNRYLKDLKNDQNNTYGKKNISYESKADMKRKKVKVDYTQ